MRHHVRRFLMVIPWFLGPAAHADEPAAVTLIGTGELSGTASDGLVLAPALLEDGVTPHDRVGGWGSALAYTGVGNRYLAVPDRGPADGTTSYVDRAYLIDVALAPGEATPVRVSLSKATILRDEGGTPLLGSAANFAQRFDPEGVRLSGRGTFFASDEYGPYLAEFAADGHRVRRLSLPDRVLIANPSATAAAELPPGNSSGRQANRGMEGLAISPDGGKLFGLMQNALIQDGALDAANARIGRNVRLFELDLASGVTRELVYVLEQANTGLNEILAINDHQLLVIERDGAAGAKAKRKSIYKIDLAGASDVACLATLPTSGLPSGVVPVSKQLFLDLLDPRFGLAGEAFPEKIEGLAFGPALPDGRVSLLVTSDNDFVATVSSKVFVFAIAPEALPGYEPQIFQPKVALLGPRRHVHPGRPGVVAALVRGSALLPVSAFVREGLRLGGAAPVAVGRAGRPLCTSFDEDGDGEPDLLCGFDQGAMQPAAALALTGRTSSGTPLSGSIALE